MLDSDCKLKSFHIPLGGNNGESFVEACFGVTIEYIWKPRQSMRFRAIDESVQVHIIQYFVVTPN